MEIGVGLPNAIPDVDAESLLEFAKRADARGFSSLGTVDRLVYPGFEPLVSLAAAAAVTDRIRLATTVLLGPGPGAEAHAERNVGHYCEFLGEYTVQIVGSVATSPEAVQSYVQAFEQPGCDELIFFPGSKHTHQVDLLADVVGK